MVCQNILLTIDNVKTIFISFCMLACGYTPCRGQATSKVDPVIEGGKLIVELVKVLSNKKDLTKESGCKNNFADLCIENESGRSLTVFLEHRVSAEKREVVILPGGKECSLQAKAGVWTYDLRFTGSTQAVRKGDILIEGCNNMVMNIK
jgi:hypothetical protein